MRLAPPTKSQQHCRQHSCEDRNSVDREKMNNKPPPPLHVKTAGFGQTTVSPTSPSLCFPASSSSSSTNKENPQHHLHQQKQSSSRKKHQNGLCGCCQRSPKSHCVSAIGVSILVLAYTALGSILFVTLEGELDDDMGTMETAVAASKPYPRTDLANADIRSRTVDRLWSITEDLNILYKENWTRLAAQEVQLFQDTLLRAVKLNSNLQQTGTPPTPKTHKWSYASAFLYSLTLITTIGYGGVSPRTQWGRIAALVYALFGIPIILLYLSAMGEGLSNAMRCIFRILRITSTSSNGGKNSQGGSSKKAKKDCNASAEKQLDMEKRGHGYHMHSDEANEKLKPHYHHQQLAQSGGFVNNSSNGNRRCSTASTASMSSAMSTAMPTVPISVCILILISYIALGAVLFSKIQRWSILESLYFCFSSLGTIGAGDLQPQGASAQYIASGYIIFGMAVVAMCFSLIQSELVIWLRRFGVQDQIQQQQQQQQHQQSSASHVQHPSQQPPQFMMMDGHHGPQSSDELALVTVTMTPTKIP